MATTYNSPLRFGAGGCTFRALFKRRHSTSEADMSDFSAKATSVPNAIKVAKAAVVLVSNGQWPSRLVATAHGNWVTPIGAVIQCDGEAVGNPARYNSLFEGHLRLWVGGAEHGAWIDARPVSVPNDENDGYAIITVETL